MSADIDIVVDCPLWSPEADWRALFARAADACAADAGARWPGREISLLLCDDAAIQTLNRTWRGFDKPTNVLSFPAAPTSGPGAPLGDIAIAFETSEREAAAAGITLHDHAMHLALHGVLHLLGMDHETEEDAGRMEAAERRILAGMGIADPYAETESPAQAGESAP